MPRQTYRTSDRNVISPQHRGWAAWQTPSQAHFSNRIGGYNPLNDQFNLPAHKLAAHLQSHGWSERRAIDADPYDRRYHMQRAGMQDEVIDQYGDDVWVHAVHVLGALEVHAEGWDNERHESD